MTDFLGELEHELVAAVYRHAAGQAERRAHWRGRIANFGGIVGHRRLTAALALFVLCGLAAGATVKLTASRPPTVTLPGGPAPAGGSTQTRYEIAAFPYMQVGWSGWCSRVAFQPPRGRSGSAYGCAPVAPVNSVIVTRGRWFAGANRVDEYEILTDVVTTVRFSDGRTAVPLSDPRLPNGTHAFFAADLPVQTIASTTTHVVRLRETWLDRAGRLVPAPAVTGAAVARQLPVRVVNPSRPGAAVCAVRTRVAGLTPLAETVVTPRGLARAQAGAFLACANATFQVGPSTLALAVLVAADARRPAPPLPGLRPDPLHPGVLTGFQLGSIGFPNRVTAVTFSRHSQQLNPPALAQLTDFDVSARRAGGAWLVAEGGTKSDRATLLSQVFTRA